VSRLGFHSGGTRVGADVMESVSATCVCMCAVCTRTHDVHEAVGVDVLSHQKKATFWRELVELFPNLIDYLCNPNVNPVRYA
jgi:hypothetical protein